MMPYWSRRSGCTSRSPVTSRAEISGQQRIGDPGTALRRIGGSTVHSALQHSRNGMQTRGLGRARTTGKSRDGCRCRQRSLNFPVKRKWTSYVSNGGPRGWLGCDLQTHS